MTDSNLGFSAEIPHFKATAGNGLRVNVRDHDGFIHFGSGRSLFTTRWDGAFRSYRQGDLTGVAVQVLDRELDSFTEADLTSLNYTNGERMGFVGGVLVHRRLDGSYLLVAPRDTHHEGNEVAILTFDYRMILSFPENASLEGGQAGVVDARGEPFFAGDGFVSGSGLLAEAPINAAPVNGEVSFDLYQPFSAIELPAAARELRERLSALLDASERQYAEFESDRLSNNPPPDVVIDAEYRREALDALDQLAAADPQSAAGRDTLSKAGKLLFRVAAQIVRWAGRKLDHVVDAALETVTQEGIKFAFASTLFMQAWNVAGSDLMKLGISALQAAGKLP